MVPVCIVVHCITSVTILGTLLPKKGDKQIFRVFFSRRVYKHIKLTAVLYFVLLIILPGYVPSVTSFYHFIQSLERRLEPKLLRLLLELPPLRREECVVCERFNIDATCPYTYGSM